MDDIRMSSMANARFISFITEIFGFTESGDAEFLFNERELGTFPQPLAFRSGIAPTSIPEEDNESIEEVAVRRFSISATQILIDVAGPTSLTQTTFDFFRYLVGDARTPEGKPFIGIPIATRDQSLIVVRRPDWTTASFLNQSILPLLAETFEASPGHEFIPAIEFPAYSLIEPSGSARPENPGWRLSLRFGTTPEDHCFQSTAKLSSDDHLAFLHDLSARLA